MVAVAAAAVGIGFLAKYRFGLLLLPLVTHFLIFGSRMRLLHVMIRVGELQRSIDFYTEALGMRLLRKSDYAEGKFTLAFLGYGAEESNTVLELTHNWETASYELGNGFGHLAVAAPDIHEACARIRASAACV